MKIVNVALKENSYRIVIGQHILPRLGQALKGLNIGRDALIITSRVIRRHHGAALASSLKENGFCVKFFEVPDGEQSKSVKTAFSLIERIACYDCGRQSFIVAFGGGVIGDLAGYVAAVYKRGVPYIQVPTTFLAQIDSAIGGKTAIDLVAGKNLVGAFYQPRIVWSDVAVLATLDKRQMRNGLAEAVKYGMIADSKLFTDIARHYQELIERRLGVLESVVIQCSRIKTAIVTKDERETQGIRTILNFGHTVGHAIEAAGDYRRYHHGEAVALGMRVAAAISYQRGMLGNKDLDALNRLLSDIGLPQKIKGLSVADIIAVMRHDKKFKGGKNRFVLAQKIGQVKIVTEIPPSVIRYAIHRYMD